MTAKDIQEILGVGKRKSYEIMDSKDFPLVRLGSKLKRVLREDFFEWFENQKNK
ncbi:helix-turn-helix domain-containing protein [Rossellomorea yichunensis]|uniref:helix-turn-helix domain-containing protein n=1 Tax=Rossellomorea yichunensis TaxID=3077331 RepID=UPI0028DD598E|nr:helix-turn-helix domain-containing protein [Rossellomorea sp. YC4-1]MDT9027805.1 helix-turn-helix domain-containing protein [Rossellomorea sp. YC4-1]